MLQSVQVRKYKSVNPSTDSDHQWSTSENEKKPKYIVVKFAVHEGMQT